MNDVKDDRFTVHNSNNDEVGRMKKFFERTMVLSRDGVGRVSAAAISTKNVVARSTDRVAQSAVMGVATAWSVLRAKDDADVVAAAQAMEGIFGNKKS